MEAEQQHSFEEIFVGDRQNRVDVISSTLGSTYGARFSSALDTPGSIPAGYSLESHIYGGRVGEFYLFARIGPDSRSTRPGMVFSHGLAMPIEEVGAVEDIGAIFDYLQPERHQQVQADKRDLPTHSVDRDRPSDRLCEALLAPEVPSLLTIDAQLMSETAVSIWPVLTPAMRQEFRFGLALSPDGRDGLPLHIALVPRAIQAQFDQSMSIQDFAPRNAPKAPSTAAGRALVSDLKPVMVDLTDDLQVSTGFASFVSLAVVANVLTLDFENFERVLAALHTVLKTQPDPSKGLETKRTLMDGLLAHPELPTISRLLQLRNLNFYGLGLDQSELVEALKLLAIAALQDSPANSDVTKALKSILRVQLKPTVWAKALSLAVMETSQARVTSLSKGFLTLMTDPTIPATPLTTLVEPTAMDRSVKPLIKAQGLTVHPERAEAFAKAGLFHSEAEFLVNRHTGNLDLALAESVGRSETVFGTVATKRCLAAMTPRQQIIAALRHENDRVQNTAIQAIVDSPHEIGSIGLMKPGLIELWNEALKRDDDAWKSHKTLEETQSAVLDDILLSDRPESEPELHDEIIEALMKSPAGDWIDHPRASEALSTLEGSALSSALSLTTASWINCYPDFEMDNTSLSPPHEIGVFLGSNEAHSDVLRALRQNTIGVALQAFLQNGFLQPSLFKVFILEAIGQTRALDQGTALTIGRLLVERRWGDLTRDLFRRFKHRRDLRPAFEVASQHLGMVDRWVHSFSQPSDSELRSEFAQLLAQLYPFGLSDKDILERAGGSLERFDTNLNGSTAWERTIRSIHNGASPTYRALINEALNDYPDNEHLRFYERVFEI